MKEECIICKAPLIYLEKDEMMECVLCHKKELSKTRCEQGHYVCNECHTKGMGVITVSYTHLDVYKRQIHRRSNSGIPENFWSS